MIRTPRFLASLLNCPQMIEPSAGAAVLTVLAPDARLSGWDGDRENASPDCREYQVCNGIAIIPVVGELVHRGSFMDASSGLCSYQALADMIEDAITDSNVSAVLLDIDSPGGVGAGCLDLSERIASMRGIKPITASVNQRAHSAAYAIASAADRIVIGKDGSCGSIGVVWAHADLSKAYDEAGVLVTYLFAGDRKIDGAPELPLSDDARARFQADIDAIYTRFCEVVAANRGMTVEAVRATQAATYRGADAVSVGLADAIATQEETLMALENKSAPPGARLSAPTASGAKIADGEGDAFKPCPDCKTPDQCAKDGACATKAADKKPVPGCGDVAADPAAIAEACAAANMPATMAAGLMRVGATMAAVNDRIAEASAITEAATLAGMPGMGAKLVAAGVSLASARDLIAESRASKDDAIQTDTAHGNVSAATASGWDAAVASLKPRK